MKLNKYVRIHSSGLKQVELGITVTVHSLNSSTPPRGSIDHMNAQ